MQPRYPFPEVFDSSMLACLKACHQLFYKVYIEEWKSKSPNIHFVAGGAYAKGLEVTRRCFYEADLSADDSIVIGMWEVIRQYGDTVIDEESAKQCLDMAGAFLYYFDNYPLNHEAAYPILLPGGKRAIEFSFVHPLGINHPVTDQPILYCGRADAILQYAGAAYIFDEKTTGQMGPTWPRQWKLRSQYTAYSWGAKESGIPVKGVVTRGICILKSEYKTAESIDNFLDWELDRWYGEALEWISDAIRYWKTGRWRYNLDNSCTSYGGCGFLSVCKNEDERPWLETYYERRHWNPITREERLL
jgi:hypothetical protein